jgi:5'-methylthioadenosine phosphorylase
MITEPAIAIIGGSGLYDMDGAKKVDEHKVKTPFGFPSDLIIQCELSGRKVFFLPRHGRGHTILPHELNHRANFWALKSHGVAWAISVTAVGSLQQTYAPRDIVLPDQFFDRTSRRDEHTFFGEGICAHIAFGEPISHQLRELIFETASSMHEGTVHNGGTYVNMDGPAFSTRAESLTNQRLGFDVIGMTNLPEAKLAKESEIALSTMSMVTDYDCWKIEEDPVTADVVIGHLNANAESAKNIIKSVVPKIPENPDWEDHRSLDGAIIGNPESWPEKTKIKLQPILSNYLNRN